MKSKRYGAGCVLLLLVGWMFGVCAAPLQAESEANRALHSIKRKDLKRHLFELASDRYEGREAGTPGGWAAGEYLAERLDQFGLMPVGDDGTFFQAFPPEGSGDREDLGTSNYLRLLPARAAAGRMAEVDFGCDFTPCARSALGMVKGKVVFAGYGITAPDLGYDDYHRVETEERVVIVLDHEPQEHEPESPFEGTELSVHGTIARKVQNAVEHGASALLILRDAGNHSELTLPKGKAFRWPPPEGVERWPIPVLYLDAEAAREVFGAMKRTISSVQSWIDKKLKPRSFEVSRFLIALRVARQGRYRGERRNLVALCEGTDEALKDEFIVVGAHYDHVGRGHFASRGKKGEIHNGADDNASGTSAVLEVAEALSMLDFRRSVLVIFFDGEEKGLLGSKYYCEHPLLPLENTIAMVNMDMVSRNSMDEISVGAAERCPSIYEILLRINRKYRMKLKLEGMGEELKQSDQWAFLEKGIPGLFFFGGEHEDYHTERDDAERCNLGKMQVMGQLVFMLLYRIDELEERP